MVYRYTWLAAAWGVALVLARLNRLVRPSTEGVPWQAVLLVALLLGGLITWIALSYRLRPVVVAAVNLVAVTLLAFRIAAPDATFLFVPTADGVQALGSELAYAGEVIRAGSAPVIASSGLVVVLSALMWLLGSVIVFGLRRNRPFLALIPVVSVYLYLATVDRVGFRPLWILGLLVLAAGGLAAISTDERLSGTGRLSAAGRAGITAAVPTWSAAIVTGVVGVAMVATMVLLPAVPSTGIVEWRYQRGLSGNFYGGVSYNPFVNVQRSLVNPTNTPVFVATTDGPVDGDDLYWKLLTLDSFNGSWWFAAGPKVDIIDGGAIERRDFRFAGPTEQVTQEVTILALSMDWLPAAYAPVAVSAPDTQVLQGIRGALDGSLRFGSLSFEGMQYEVVSEVPQPDVAALAVDGSGEPTPAFAEAIEDGVFSIAPTTPDLRDRPPNADQFLALPESLDPEIVSLALDITRGAEGPYEQALALETYLRSPANGFRYDTSTPAADGADDLATWLLDTSHPDYRVGYCEQYASALGVLGRAVGIPSRVVLGFTPGDDIGDGRVVVRDNNAHAWVEFWMPAQGWVRFDATPRSDGVNPSAASDLEFDIAEYLEAPEAPTREFETAPLPRPEFGEDLPEAVGGLPIGGQQPGRTFELPDWVSNAALLIVAVGVAVGGLPLYKSVRRRRRLRRLRHGDITAAWHEIVDQLSDLGAAPRPGQTPNEYAAGTHASVVAVAAVYSEAVYGPGTMTEERTQGANDALRHAEGAIEARYSPWQRVLARYRLRSVLRGRRRRD